MARSRPSPIAILFGLEGTLLDSDWRGAPGEGRYEGVREMLAILASAGYPLGIVSGRDREFWRMTAAILPPEIFEVVITKEEVVLPQPHAEGLLAAAAALSIDPARIAFIGGAETDLLAGCAAGMAVGAALWARTDTNDRGSFLGSISEPPLHWLFERPADVTREFVHWC